MFQNVLPLKKGKIEAKIFARQSQFTVRSIKTVKDHCLQVTLNVNEQFGKFPDGRIAHACRHKRKFHGNLNGFLVTLNCHILTLTSVIPNFVARLVLLVIAFSLINLISSSGTSSSCYNHLTGGDYI